MAPFTAPSISTRAFLTLVTTAFMWVSSLWYGYLV